MSIVFDFSASQGCSLQWEGWAAPGPLCSEKGTSSDSLGSSVGQWLHGTEGTDLIHPNSDRKPYLGISMQTPVHHALIECVYPWHCNIPPCRLPLFRI